MPPENRRQAALIRAVFKLFESCRTFGEDDIGLDEIKVWFPSSREPATVHRTVVFDWFESYIYIVRQNKNPHPNGWGFVLVDDIGLEPMTFRTSSGCSSQLS